MADLFDGAEFSSIEQTEIDKFILGQKAEATRSKEKYDYNRLKKFFNTVNESREIDNIPTNQLDNLLCQFFMKATNLKGELYEPDTLTGFWNSFQRILFERGSKVDLKKDSAFANCRNVLRSRRKQLKKLGKGNKPNATRALSLNEVDFLFNSGYFGLKNPVSLQRTVWWYLTTHFGHRARDEARQMLFGDIKVEFDHEINQHYLIWDTERSTKTRTGERPVGSERVFNPKIYATGTERCPVDAFNSFTVRRPQNMLKDNSPLFLQYKYLPNYTNEVVWYYDKPLGKNMIGKFLSDASKILPARKSNSSKVANHSARKTSITSLLNENVNPIHVQQLSGHKKLESLANYHVASEDHQRQMSSILSRTQPKPLQPCNSKSIEDEDISFDIQRQMMEKWDPVLPSVFQGAHITNCTFNININYPSTSTDDIPRKERES